MTKRKTAKKTVRLKTTRYENGQPIVSFEDDPAERLSKELDEFEWVEIAPGRSRLVHKGRMAERQRSNSGVIVDSLGADLEHMGFADGRRTDSKSVFRRWTKECGGVEMGNDRERRPVRGAVTAKDVAQDVGRSIDMLRQGYKPSIFNTREWGE